MATTYITIIAPDFNIRNTSKSIISHHTTLLFGFQSETKELCTRKRPLHNKGSEIMVGCHVTVLHVVTISPKRNTAVLLLVSLHTHKLFERNRHTQRLGSPPVSLTTNFVKLGQFVRRLKWRTHTHNVVIR
jgi:hypothetical protein